LVERIGFKRPPPPLPSLGTGDGAAPALSPGVSPPAPVPAPVAAPVEAEKETEEKKKDKKRKDKKRSSKEGTTPVPRRSSGVEETPEDQANKAEVIRAEKAVPLERRKAEMEERFRRKSTATSAATQPLLGQVAFQSEAALPPILAGKTNKGRGDRQSLKPPAPAGDSEQGATVKSTTEIEVT
jgi:hypothetical protein